MSAFADQNHAPSLTCVRLESQTELEVMSLLKSCVSDFGQTLIMITHDETIAQMADEMIIIEDGKAVRR